MPYVISLRAEGMVGPGARDRDERGVDCIDCHKGIAHELPNMEGVDPGWKVPPELEGEELPAASVFDRLERIARSPHGTMWSFDDLAPSK